MVSKESDIRNAIWQLAFQFKVSSKKAIRQYGLPLNGMHVRILHMIGATPACTANRIVLASGRDKAQITRLLKELEGMSLIQRAPNPDDKRSQIVSLSGKGEALMARAREAEQDVVTRLLKGMKKDEIDTFVGLAGRMLDNLREE